VSELHIPQESIDHTGHALDDDRTLEEAARMISAPVVAAELRRIAATFTEGFDLTHWLQERADELDGGAL
jgi:hypothetical protein